MGKAKKPVVTRNFLKQLSRGLVKSIPAGGSLLEQVIYGTLDGEAAQKESQKLHKILSRISQQLESQEADFAEILLAQSIQANFNEKILTEFKNLANGITDPDNAVISKSLQTAIDNTLTSGPLLTDLINTLAQMHPAKLNSVIASFPEATQYVAPKEVPREKANELVTWASKEKPSRIPSVIEVIHSIESKGGFPESPSPVAPVAGRQINTAKLPSTSADLFGREGELKLLDKAWQDKKTNILTFVAFGGVGKTALVNYWLTHQMLSDNYRGAQRVFGWSFYSQGAAEGKQVSADVFIDSALRFFSDPETADSKLSGWEKGARIAELVQQQKTLLILDGLEPLQRPHPPVGQIKDHGLASLVRNLAVQNPGLCILTTRLRVDDLKGFTDTTVKSVELEDLSVEAGIELLKNAGVTNASDDELKEAVSEYKGHALALTLLGSYLKVVHKGDIRKRDKIPHLADEQRQGAHARRVMVSYEKWFKGKAELNILYIVGLFDRPADSGAIEAVKNGAIIEGLTDKLVNLSEAGWKFDVNNLREVRLLAPEDENAPGTLDAHPLVREYFGEKLQSTNPKGWQQAHNRLYEYYKSSAKELPDTIEEMTPLFLAVAHGCQAGHYQEVYQEVYRRRIQRGDEAFNTKKLGAFGADLAALAGFFEIPWNQPVSDLRDENKGFVLNAAGFRLRALGRLEEAVQPFKASLDIAIAVKDWRNATIAASNLSELHLTLGKFSEAQDYAQQSVKYTDRSGDDFARMGFRTTLADVLHQAGRFSEAEKLFREAEEIQKQWQPEYPLLYSLWGFRYCDLLLSQGKYEEVLRRASKMFEWRMESDSLLTIALDYLSLGRAHLFQVLHERTGNFNKAAEHLNQAVDGLRKSANQDDIPRGLLARAELYRVTEDFNSAQRDLDEAFALATRCGMKLHEVDCCLGYARLYLAEGEIEKARENFAKAEGLINDIGYHRRDKELSELKRKLA